MKFAFSSNAFRRYGLIETIQILSAIGYQGIEIMADVPHAYPNHISDTDLKNIRKALDDNGLEISNLNAFMHHADGDTYHPSWIEPEPGLLIENSEQFVDFFGELDPDVFGLNCDLDHFFCVGEDPVRIIKEMNPVIHHFHLEDIAASREHYHLMLGEGAIHLPQVFKAIWEIGYEGFVTVELYTDEEEADNAARKAHQYLQDWREANTSMLR
jgi:sugar phosphate isomerase/epimerase